VAAARGGVDLAAIDDVSHDRFLSCLSRDGPRLQERSRAVWIEAVCNRCLADARAFEGGAVVVLIAFRDLFVGIDDDR
jgi:hypothetical protein